MLTQVSVVPPVGALWPQINLPVLASGGLNGLFISKIDGLSPVQSTVQSRGFGFVDGEFYSGSKVGKRNLVLHINIETRRNDIDAARRLLYGYFMTKRPILLEFQFDNRDPVRIEGYYETIESDRWVQDLEMQISVICPKPNFVAVTPKTIAGNNDQLSNPIEIINGGDQSIGVEWWLNTDTSYEGTVSLEAMVLGQDGSYFSDRNLRMDNVFMSSWHRLFVDSRQGQKKIQIVDESEPDVEPKSDILYSMDPASVWPVLHPGSNLLRAHTWADSLLRTWDLRYYEQFGAI